MSTSDPAASGPRSPERALRRLTRAALGTAVVPVQDGTVPDAAVVDEAARSAREARLLAPLARALTRGATFDEAVVATVRQLLDVRERQTARALAMGAAGAGSPWLPDLCIALIHHDRFLFDSAWDAFRGVDAEALATHAPAEAIASALHSGTPEGREVALGIAAVPDRLATEALANAAGPLLVFGETDRARSLLDELARREAGGEPIPDEVAQVVTNLRRWTHPAPPPTAPPDAVRVAVIDYYQPDLGRSSRNVGDYVQTLSMLGHLARHQQVEFTGEAGLGELATDLQGRVRPELRIDEPAGRVHLSTVSRDYSEGDPIAPDTWMVAFGWHMHPMWKLRFGMPYHPNLNPIFASFHVNHVELLTAEAIDYLRAHGPIGCRDWTTVYLLLSAGVDAFFTGCVTSTVGNLFPDRDQVRTEPGVVAAIDYPAGKVKANRPIESSTNVEDKYRFMDLTTGVRDAIDRLDDYQRRYHRIVTSRLHSYLPGTSLGIPVTFRPKTIGDVRFDGLLDMTPEGEAFVAMRDGITGLLGEVLPLVVSGAPSDEVYARWREVTAPLVEQARARLAAPVRMETAAVDGSALVAKVAAGRRDVGPAPAPGATDVALSTDQNLARMLPVTIESIVANASGPLHLWLCTRGLGPDYQDWLSAAFPEVAITFLPFDDVDYGEITRMITHITVSTMDRLLLPDLLPELDRITYIDIDTVTEGDVCELAAIDLGGRSFAARESYFRVENMWRNAGDHLSADRAAELRRAMAAKHPFGTPTLNAGVLVLDLARLRADRFVDWCLPMVADFGLNDQDVLLAWAGDDYQRLEPRWNALPIVESIEDWAIVHYAGIGKPWSEDLTPHREHWRRYAERVAARAPAPPASA
ncbi:lipopolysaccharide biosynthesis glycosyltransferase [Nocardioides thalensis]|uniref:Lipopolysaccharide biosynthesis glycosyltransferase n=1 Tax=Nocardioides thalensis TaxID=1914755 RepID=A0A853C168_9ACTN|nr:glycosyltransferase [Nocardioides thalensis]NYJ00756.1 lipopolysaccharide biosynthesis glycosyltransferase [Nocardioides thalensis]